MDYSYLVQKYDVPGPRYTSYPTVPYWELEKFSVAGYKKILNSISSEQDISIYIHLPFCESLCTYCGCTTRITKNHQHEYPYIEAVKKEWDLYCKEFESVPQIKEIHLGGGTPTFFEPENLRDLINYLIKENDDLPEISLEGHPNSTTFRHL